MRAFVAIDVSSDAIVELQKDILSTSGWTAKDVRPVEPHNFHFTLIFLGEITDIANSVIGKLSELGFRADKPFSAHMTILRSKGRTVNTSYISSKYQGRTFGSDWIDKVHLKKSELRTSGSIYSNVLTVEAKK